MKVGRVINAMLHATDLPREVLYEPRRPKDLPGDAPLLSSPMSATPLNQPQHATTTHKQQQQPLHFIWLNTLKYVDNGRVYKMEGEYTC